ncbi:hypothetical protein HYY72_03275 [Candidatus Woesearchaeota archaeon]|nr:hypothetical protein [Candidatus Woesearchaeota archaeon]
MKAQLSIEFAYAVAIALIILIFLAFAVNSQLSGIKEDRNVFLIRDTASGIRSEIFIASDAQDGYERVFKIPHNLSGMEFNATIQNSTIILGTPDFEYILRIPYAAGNIEKGDNRIRKSGGVVYIN